MTMASALFNLFIISTLCIQTIVAQKQCSFKAPVNQSSIQGPLDDGGRVCTVRNRYFYANTDDFLLHTSAECYFYLSAKYLKRRPCLALPYVCFNAEAQSFSNGDCHLPEVENKNSSLFRAVQDAPSVGFRWLTCFHHSIECCKHMRAHLEDAPEGVCRSTWDGLTCFHDTPAGSVVVNSCPSFLYSKTPKCTHTSSRQCLEDGTWFRKANSSEEYTNYRGCSPKERDEEIATVYYFAVALFSLSIIFCLPAIIIFSSFRALQCQRISMHKNLIVSVMLSSLMQLMDHSFLTIPAVTSHRGLSYVSNAWWCKVLQVLQKYFWSTQYTWMLCEGFYLHSLVSQAFIHYSTLAKYYSFGWGFPALSVSVYAVFSALYADTDCWRSITVYDYIVTGPATLCLLLNLFFMTRVIVIIVSKLQGPENADNVQEHNSRRVFRAVIILTPLFGVHYFISIFASGAACANKLLISYISWFCVSSQGMFVSLVLCYLNEEVQYHLKKTYYRIMDRSQFELVNYKPTQDARMSTITVSSDLSSALLHRPSIA